MEDPLDKEASAAYEAARQAYGAGDQDAALASALKALEMHPTHGDTLKLLGGIEIARGNHEQARNYYGRLLNQHPDDPEVLKLIAEVFLAESRYDDALELCERSLSRLPWDAETMELRADILERMGAHDEAERARRQAGAIRAGRAEYLEPRPLDLGISVVSDLPTESDLLEFQPLVDGLCAFLNSKDTKLPLAIAVTAPWGAGKSSVMLQLKARLERGSVGTPHHSRARRWQTVWLDAWKYEKSERLWVALARAIYGQPYRNARNALWRLTFLLRLEWRRLGGWLFIPRVIVRLAVVTGTFFAFYVFGRMAGGTANVAAVAGGAGSVVILAAEGARLWTTANITFKRALEVHTRRPRYEDQLGFTQEANRDIDHLMRSLTAHGNQAVAVFVDDLDRCSSSHIVETIEAVNQIFHDPSEKRQCVFVLGMDREVVAANIEAAYAEVIRGLKAQENPMSEDFGFSFLSKIVQISVAIPPPSSSAIAQFLAKVATADRPADAESGIPSAHLIDILAHQITDGCPASPVEVRNIRQRMELALRQTGQLDDETNRQLDEAERQVRARLFISDSEDVRYAESEVLRLLERNPRQVKRFVNAFRLQLHVASCTPGCTLDFTREQLIALGKWVAVRLRWPRLAQALDRNPSLMKALERKANGIPVTLDISGDEKWLLDTGVCSVLEEADRARWISSLGQTYFLRIA